MCEGCLTTFRRQASLTNHIKNKLCRPLQLYNKKLRSGNICTFLNFYDLKVLASMPVSNARAPSYFWVRTLTDIQHT